VSDHFFQLDFVGPVELEMLESYTTLSFLASITRKIKLGALVTGAIYRYPGILIKTITTLDVLSGGRAYFGIGTGWFEREAVGLGVPFPSVKVRFERLEETLLIAKQMWSDDNGSFQGKHFQLAETLCSPQPISEPHPPIMIGGLGEKKTLRFVAQYGDATNMVLDFGIDIIPHKLDVLKKHCEELNRPYHEIERTTLGAIWLGRDGETASDVIKICSKLAQMGVQHAIFDILNAFEIEPLETFGKEIIPTVRDF
jgi:F420-dependent oxidoreductase-like protein